MNLSLLRKEITIFNSRSEMTSEGEVSDMMKRIVDAAGDERVLKIIIEDDTVTDEFGNIVCESLIKKLRSLENEVILC
ncbi:MAG: hypothetical protein ACRBCT_04230 [Alphaproteobacteria bacterium]